MGVMNSIAYLSEELEPILSVQHLPITVIIQGLAFDIFHDQIRRPVFGCAAVKQTSDVRMIERGEDAALRMKALDDLGMDQVARHHFDRNQTSRNSLIVARGKVDNAHAAATQLAKDAVGAESRGPRIGSGEAPGRIDHCSRDLRRVQRRSLEKRACPMVRHDERLELGAKRRISGTGAFEQGVTSVRCQIDGFGEHVFQAAPAGRPLSGLGVHRPENSSVSRAAERAPRR